MTSNLEKKNETILKRIMKPETELLKIFGYWLEQIFSSYYNNSSIRNTKWGLNLCNEVVTGKTDWAIKGNDEQLQHSGVVTFEKQGNSASCSLSMNIKGYVCEHTRFVGSINDANSAPANVNFHFKRGKDSISFRIGQDPGVEFCTLDGGVASFEISSNMLKASFATNENGKHVRKTVCYRGKKLDNDHEIGYEHTTFIRDADVYRNDIQESLIATPSDTDKSTIKYLVRIKNVNGATYPSFGEEKISLEEYVRKHGKGLEDFKHFLAIYSMYAPDFVRNHVFSILTKKNLEEKGLQLFSPYDLINHIVPELRLIKFLGLSIKWDASRFRWVIFDKENNPVGTVSYSKLKTDDSNNDVFGYHMDLKYNNTRCVRDRDENQLENNVFDFDIMDGNGIKKLTMLVGDEPLLVLKEKENPIATLQIGSNKLSFSTRNKDGYEVVLNYQKDDMEKCEVAKTQIIDSEKALIERTEISQANSDTVIIDKTSCLKNLVDGTEYKIDNPDHTEIPGILATCDVVRDECVANICRLRDLLREQIPFADSIVTNWLRPMGLRARGFDLFVRHYDASNRGLKIRQEEM